MAQSTFDFSAAGICEALKIPLAAKFPDHVQAGWKPTGMLSFLKSQKNMEDFRADILSRGSKAPNAILSFDVRDPENELVLETEATSCDTTNCSTPVIAEVEVKLDNVLSDCVTVNQRDINQLCEVGTDIGPYLAKQLNKKMRDMAVRLNKAIVTEINGNLGLNVVQGDNLIRPLNMLSATSGTILAGGWTDLEIEYQRNLLGGMPCIVGAGNVEKFARLAGVACCTDEGVDLSAMTSGLQTSWFRDYHVGSVTTVPDAAMVMAPGYTQLVSYSGGMNSSNDGGNTTFRKISHPSIPGLEFELKTVHDCENVSMFLSIWYKLCQFPGSDFFAATHELNVGGIAVNGSNLYSFDAV